MKMRTHHEHTFLLGRGHLITLNGFTYGIGFLFLRFLKKRFTCFGIKLIRSNQIIRNRGCRFTKHISNHCIKSNITDSKGILEAVFLTPFATGHLKPVTGIFLQNSNLFTGNKTAWNKTKPKKVTNPFGGFGIIVVAFNSFYPFGIGNSDVYLVLKKIKDRNPVFSGRFHADIKAGVFQKPLFKTPDVAVKSGKALFLVNRLNIFGGFNDCGDEKGFIDINATTGWINNFHENQVLS